MEIKVCPLSELDDGKIKTFDSDGVDGVVVRQGDTLYAFEAYCSHELFPLEFGIMSGDALLRCTAHGSDFDLRTGKCLGPPATEDIKVYPVRVEDGEIIVEVPDEA